jgi:hypothetical protein
MAQETIWVCDGCDVRGVLMVRRGEQDLCPGCAAMMEPPDGDAVEVIKFRVRRKHRQAFLLNSLRVPCVLVD